jgi:hypothetical protein
MKDVKDFIPSWSKPRIRQMDERELKLLETCLGKEVDNAIERDNCETILVTFKDGSGMVLHRSDKHLNDKCDGEEEGA